MGGKCSSDTRESTEMTENARLLAHDSAGVANVAEVVLLHAFPLDRRLWSRVLESPPAGSRVTAIDMPGWGSSSLEALGGSGNFDFDEVAEAVAETLEELGIERAIFGGCSMGGFACFAMVRRHPEMVSGLFLSDTRAVADTPEMRDGRRALIEMIERGGIDKLAELMVQRLLGSRTLTERDVVVEEVREIISEQSPATAIATLRGMAARPDSTPLLAELTVPVTVLVGDEDPTVPVADAALLAESIANAELVVVEGAGHLPAIEDPEPVISAIADLVARVR